MKLKTTHKDVNADYESIKAMIEHDPQLSAFKGNEQVMAPMENSAKAANDTVNSSLRRQVMHAQNAGAMNKIGKKDPTQMKKSMELFDAEMSPLLATFEKEVKKMRSKVELELKLAGSQ